MKITRILAIIFGILILIGGIAYAAWVAYLASICSSYVGIDPYCGGALLGFLIFPIWLVLSGLLMLLIYMNAKSIEHKVDARQYRAAKDQTLIWMILGFIFGILFGILFLIVWLKFDPLINAQSGAGGSAPPSGGYAAPPPAPPAPPAPGGGGSAPPPAAAPAAPFCSKCGKPTTFIQQYGRYYCYDDQLYV